MSLDPSRDGQVEELFAEALDVSVKDRLKWLEDACRGDVELLAEVRSLLEAFSRAPEILDRRVFSDLPIPESRPEIDPLAGRTLGSWRIIRLIATGGMGAVYLGERVDDSFRMKVAIKVLAAGSYHPGLLSRFRTERQILADLDHPGIARLLDGGTTTEGTPYLVMEYVEGSSIREAVGDRQLTVESRLRLFVEVAEAVQYAHTNLVIHRDLKPGNIFLREDGRPKLLDFGIAKVFHAVGAGDGTETVAGTAWALTPRYASPEQIRGERVTTATDIYSLGVVLYELLTGRLPYEANGGSVIEIGQAICETPPTPPSRVPDLPDAHRLQGDIDTILMKALSKEAGRRYASVADLAEDVRRHLDGEPVLARGDSAGYRIGRFARRHRGLVLGIGAFVAMLIVALVVTLTFYHDARNSAETARWSAYTSTMAATESAIMNHNIKEAHDLIGGLGNEPREWEYRHLEARLDRSLVAWKGHEAGITKVRFSGDGTRILSTGVDRAARLWDTGTRDSVAVWHFPIEVESGVFLPGNRVAVGLTDGSVMIATVGNNRPQLLDRKSSYALIDTGPDGNVVAAGFETGEVALYDADTMREIRHWKAHSRLAVPAISPDGTLLATGGADSLVRIWSLEDGSLRRTLRGHRQRVFALAFSKDGKLLASGSRDRTATVWDVASGLPVSSFSEHRGTVSPLVFHPDGRSVLSAGSEGRVMVWSPTTGARTAEYHGHQFDVSAVDISPAGDLAVTGEWGGTLRLWKWGTDDIRVFVFPGTGDLFPFIDMDIEPTGTLVAAVNGPRYDLARRVMVRDLAGGPPRIRYIPGASAVAYVDSTVLLVGTTRGTILNFHPFTQLVDSTRMVCGALNALAENRRDGTVASGGEDGFVHLWRVPTLEHLRGWKASGSPLHDVEFDPSGTRLVTAAKDGSVRIWNAGTGDSLASLRLRESEVRDVVFHPKDDLVAFTQDGGVYFWNFRTHAPDTLLASGNGAVSVTFSPDGERAIVGNTDALVRVFDVRRRSPILRLHGHLSRVSSLQFAADGNTLVSASYDGTLRVWDTGSNR